MKPVTALLPMYNSISDVGWEAVELQIRSVLDQTYTNLRLIVLNDGSTDDTPARVEQEFGGGRVEVRHNERNLGLVGSVERLLSFVETDYYALVDHDDCWERDKIAKTVARLEETGADLAYTDLRVVDSNLKEIAPSSLRYSNMPRLEGKNPWPLLIKNPIHGCTAVGRRENIKSMLPFPQGIPMHDRWIGLCACLGKGLAYVDEPLMLYRQHGANASGDLPFSPAGLKRRSRGNLWQYLRNRLAGRLAYARGLSRLMPDSKSLKLLTLYYKSPRILRLLCALPYLLTILALAHAIGPRNILADTTLTSLAPKE